MYKLKQIPEDFIVKEINELKFEDNGPYSYFILKKKNYNTIKAVEAIAEKLRVNIKNISFAGNKDRNAVTEQVISIFNAGKAAENIVLKDIGLKFLGKGNKEIFVGNLAGNEFTVTVRNLSEKDIKKFNGNIKSKKILMPNFFGPQRFSHNNADVGRSILKKDFRKTIDLILESNSDYSGKIKNHLETRKNDFVGALKIMPLKLLKLYVHSYQSHIFNEALNQCIKGNNKSKTNKEKIPIIGFSTELKNSKLHKAIKKIIDEEKITLRDFIIRQIPDLSSEGDERNAFTEIKNFKVIAQEKDELNWDKKKLILNFSLQKGSYATVLVEYLLS